MSHLLLIDLPANPDAAVPWLLWDDEERRVVAGGSLAGPGALSELQDYSRQYPAIAIVPGESVSHFRVTLPSAGSAAQSALPYQIEEQLCEDLEQQHITSEKIVAHQPISAVVVDRALMRQWTDALQRAELRVRAALPDFMLLPDDTVLLEEQRAVVCRGAHRATLDRDNLPQWWSLAGGQDEAEIDVIQAVEYNDWLPQRHRLKRAGSRLEALAAYRREPTLSMLHGEFRLRDPVRENLQLWRKPAIAAAALLLLHWSVLGLETIRLKREQAALDSAIEQVYRETFPDAQRVVNPRSQMRSQLQALEQSRTGGPLLTWLQYTSQALKDRRDIEIKQVHYQQQPLALRLSVNAPDYAAVDSLTQALGTQNIAVERGAFSQRGSVIDGQILIREGG